MIFNGNTQLTIAIDSPAELETEWDLIFIQHAAHVVVEEIDL